jgi:hypothetical protein
LGAAFLGFEALGFGLALDLGFALTAAVAVLTLAGFTTLAAGFSAGFAAGFGARARGAGLAGPAALATFATGRALA